MSGLVDQRRSIEAALGFNEIHDVTSMKSIAHMFPPSKPRCGIYFLKFGDGLCYIGQAVDVVRRFAQHRKIYDDIVAIAFFVLPRANLDSVERLLIFKAESQGLRLKNAVHVTSVEGERDLDLVVSNEEQESFLIGGNDGESFTRLIDLPSSQHDRSSKNFQRFQSHEFGRTAVGLLQKYFRSCIVRPRTTEYSFWSVSCMPSTNVGSLPRLFAVNAASMELFVAGWQKGSHLTWAFLNVADDVLTQHWQNLQAFSERYPTVETVERSYRDAGQRQVTLHVSSHEEMLELLHDEGVCKAAAALSLRVMRKRGNLYAKYHCPQLAELTFSGL